MSFRDVSLPESLVNKSPDQTAAKPFSEMQQNAMINSFEQIPVEEIIDF